MKHNNIKTGDMSTTIIEKIYSAALPDNVLLETVQLPSQKHTSLLVWKDGRANLMDEYTDTITGIVYKAIHDAYIKKGTVRVPSGADGAYEPIWLLQDVQAFIHKYMELDPGFEEIAARYVLLTYLSDLFDKVPYLRVLGLPNTGKSRFLQVMGSLVYHPINLGGGVNVAPIFRMGDHVQMGVLIMDEVNINDSGKTSQFVQVMNNGFQRNGTVTRCVGKGFEPIPYKTFGCKILAAHISYDDPGLESRFFTQTMTGYTRKDLSMTLPAWDSWPEAEKLRKRLLNFRLHYHDQVNTDLQIPQLSQFDRRVQEIAIPLFQITGEKCVSTSVISFLQQHALMLQNTNCNTFEGMVAEAVVQMAKFADTAFLKEIKQQVFSNTGIDLTSNKVGGIVRTMGFREGRKGIGGVYIYLRSVDHRNLIDRFGIQEGYLRSGDAHVEQ